MIAFNSSYFGSDHRAVKLQLNFQKWVRKKSTIKRFCFENKWLVEENYHKIVMSAWENSRHTIDLPSRLQLCGEEISKWANDVVGNTKRRIDQLSKEIELDLLNEEDDDNSETTLNKGRLLEKLLLQEEIYWHQRSKRNKLPAQYLCYNGIHIFTSFLPQLPTHHIIR